MFNFSVEVKEILPKDANNDQKENKGPTEVVSFLSLFRFSNAMDIFYMFIGTIAGNIYFHSDVFYLLQIFIFI